MALTESEQSHLLAVIITVVVMVFLAGAFMALHDNNTYTQAQAIDAVSVEYKDAKIYSNPDIDKVFVVVLPNGDFKYVTTAGKNLVSTPMQTITHTNKPIEK